MDLTSLVVVLVGDSNNPTILNPDFLERRVFPVPSDIPGFRQPPICTPVLAQVAYDNGVTVQSEPQRILFEQSVPTPSLSRVFVAQLALAYVRAVPHVRYTAIGINPTFILKGANEYERFQNALASAYPMRHDDVVPRIQLKADYSFPDRRVSIESFQARRATDQGVEELGLLVRTNIHRDVGDSDPDDRIRSLTATLDHADSDIGYVADLLGHVPPFADSSRQG